MAQKFLEMDYRLLSEDYFRLIQSILTQYLSFQFGLPVIEKDVVDKACYVGSFDGETIAIRSDLGPQHATFLIAHLFGHTVQSCGPNKEAYSLIEMSPSFTNVKNLSEHAFERLRYYENEAAEFAIMLLEDVFGKILNQWYSDWAVADWEYFTGITSVNKHSRAIKVEYGKSRIRAKAVPAIDLHKMQPMYAY
jgi:hypothetical protein